MRPTLAALILAVAAAAPAARARPARHDARAALEEARAHRDRDLSRQARQMEYELARAHRKYRGDPFGLDAALERLRGWDERKRRDIRHAFLDRRDRIRAEALTGVDRELALAAATRNRDLRKLEREEEYERRRARNKFRGAELRAAMQRLDHHFAHRRERVRLDFRVRRAKVLAAAA